MFSIDCLFSSAARPLTKINASRSLPGSLKGAAGENGRYFGLCSSVSTSERAPTSSALGISSLPSGIKGALSRISPADNPRPQRRGSEAGPKNCVWHGIEEEKQRSYLGCHFKSHFVVINVSPVSSAFGLLDRTEPCSKRSGTRERV